MKKRNYRPLPFWSWNEKLQTEETRRQVRLMQKAGLGGFFMHARGGLETPYMGKEWFANVDAAMDEAKKCDIQPWAYDENGWPSGTADGRVCAKGDAFRQKYLQIAPAGEKKTETLYMDEVWHVYYVVNPLYVDTLYAPATDAFLKEVYEKYAGKAAIRGFFTDEPQAVRGKIPWSVIMPDTYKALYGEDLLPLLPQLFRPIGAYKETRFRFWKMVTALFSENYMKKLYTWCQSHGMQLTGHLMLEESILYQLPTNGAVMPHYAYFHIPGVDHLGRRQGSAITVLQAASVAHQLGRKQILTESYAGCGHNIGLDEMKSIFESQAVRGANLLCQHLEGYSLRGLRKRDFPPTLFYQQPWWDSYKVFNDYAAAVGEILGEGEVAYDTLLLHPQSTAWLYYDGTDNEKMQALQAAFADVVKSLEDKHILFHLGDETILEKYAHVEDDTLVIGTQRYQTVLLPPHEILFDSTKKLLEAFRKNGGRILPAAETKTNPLFCGKDILHTHRRLNGKDIYYFVNLSGEERRAEIRLSGFILDPVTREKRVFYGAPYLFAPYEAIFVETDEMAERIPAAFVPAAEPVSLEGMWQIEDCTPNLYTLDMCAFYIDGKRIEENMYLPDVMGRICREKGPVPLTFIYHVKIDAVPDSLYLLCETPEKFTITVNGKKVETKDEGWYIDIAFRKLQIAPFCRTGENEIVLKAVFRQSDAALEMQEKASKCESVKNKLTYEMEFEPLYLMGDFSVQTDGTFEEIDRETAAYSGSFLLMPPQKEVTLQNFERQGFPFFAGSVTLSKTVTVKEGEMPPVLAFQKQGWNVIECMVDGKSVRTFLWPPYKIDLRGYLTPGTHTLSFRLRDNLHNLLGPHHCRQYRKWGVSPGTFYKESCLWNKGYERPYTPEYCVAKRSILPDKAKNV